MVLVRVSAEHREKLVGIERMLSTKYMPFAYVPNASREICSLGAENAYGYAQEHHTLELWLQIWLEYNEDLVSHGTPTSCKRIIDIATCIWNKCMGNVDTLRRVVTMAKAKRGKESASGSLYWYHLLDYILYQAFRVYQHSSIEGEMDKIMTQKSFQRKRKRKKSYQEFLYQLANGLTAERMNRYFPGLQQLIDHMQPESITTLSSTELNEATGAIPLRNDDEDGVKMSAPEGYNILKSFLDPSSHHYKLRLDSSLQHYATQSNETQSAGKNKGERTRRGCCVLCCNLCDEWVKEPKKYSHSRQGRKTVDYCTACKVYLCKHCFNTFHNDADVTPPPCCRGFGMQRRPKRKRKSQESPSTISSPVCSSPKTSSRKKRSRDSSSPQGSTSITSTSARSSPKKTSNRKRRSRATSSPQGSTSVTSSHARMSPNTSNRKRRSRATSSPPGSTSITSSPARMSPKTSNRKRHSWATSSPRVRAKISAQLRSGKRKIPSSPTQSSPSPKRRTVKSKPRVRHSPKTDSDFSSPPKVSRRNYLSAILPWKSMR